MSNPDALSQKERELHLVLNLDRVRDTLHDDEDPQAMFDALAALLRDELQVDGCAIMLVAETSDEIESIATATIPQDIAIALCQEAISFEQATPLTQSTWQHSLGVQIILDDFPLGSVVLVRNDRAFDETDFALLALAESQLDSAVIQARMVWKLTQRNRELEAIFEIDRLRDATASEADLISGFTTVLLKRFNADFCMVLLSNVESGEMMLRGVIDKHDLSPVHMEAISRKAREIQIPQSIPAPQGVDSLALLAAPFIVERVRLGAVVVGRETPFTFADHRLINAMMSQMDSAIVYSRTNLQLVQRKKELEVIYRVDRIRDREKDLDAMLQAVLNEICGIVDSETGYVMLYNQGAESELELRSFTKSDLFTDERYTQIIQRFSQEALQAGKMIHANQPEGPVRSIIATPLILNEHIIGVFGVVNSARARGFDTEDRRLLAAITSQIDTAIFEHLEQRRMRSLLSRSVDPKVLEHMLQRADTSLLSGERVVLTVIFADLRGSTEWAERTDPEELVTTLNAFLGRMTDVIFKYGGTLDKFVGDEVIGLFGTPVKMEDHAYRAACAALEMQQIHQELQKAIHAQGRELPLMGIGVSSGEAIAGEFGHPVRSEFTALGRIINLGSRLCSAARGGQVIISENTYTMLGGLATANRVETLALKGISNPGPAYELTDIKKATAV
jgi:adenylate cyclase